MYVCRGSYPCLSGVDQSSGCRQQRDTMDISWLGGFCFFVYIYHCLDYAIVRLRTFVQIVLVA